MKNDWRSAMRAYAALAVLRQAALCLGHYGFHCAHAYMCQVMHQTFMHGFPLAMLCQQIAAKHLDSMKSRLELMI